tara:strand:- start:299 stop:472 length:174 start_codon:yes stop_codon:yes gene_type:complete
MVKKVKLIDDTPVEMDATPSNGGMTDTDIASMMKFLEAIDWKLWEMLKILKSETEEK